MQVLIDCRQLDLSQARGLENFGLAIILSLLNEVDVVVVDVCKTSRDSYENYLAGVRNVRIIHDPVQGFFCSLAERGWYGRLFQHFAYLLKHFSGIDLLARRRSWAMRQRADVVYYPSHRDTPQHNHLPMVSTVHAILPEYSEKDMDLLEAHICSAQAVVTSWPHPFRDLTRRYPGITEKLFLVPYSAFQLLEEPGENALIRLNLAEEFLFFPAVVSPRKNHANLIRACGLLRTQGFAVPTIYCTGGGDTLLQAKLEKLSNELCVGDCIRFLGHLESHEMSAMYRRCMGTISCSFWEAGIAPLQEGGRCGKPLFCANTPPAVEHAKFLHVKVCFFNPKNPRDIAQKLMYFLRHREVFAQSMVAASQSIKAVDRHYVGHCYAEVLRFAADLSPRPAWWPFLDPMKMTSTEM